MKTLNIYSSSHSYSVYVGKNIRFQLNQWLKKNYTHILLVTDSIVGPLYAKDIENQFPIEQLTTYTIPQGEASKNIQTFYDIQTKAIQSGLDRNSLIIALGGGVVGDIAGFVASTFMRGIEYIQMPTTILSHDSSVGGKVAINHELGKNLIGQFHPPTMVVYDVITLDTLSLKEIRSGYAELIKEAFLGDRQLLNKILQTTITELTSDQYIDHIWTGIQIKAGIVEKDELELGARKYLNLGHTLGHALESMLGYGKLTHGEAVAIGLLFAIYVSEQKYSETIGFEKLFRWLQANEYPLGIEELHTSTLLKNMKADKKVVNNCIHMVLLKQMEQPIVEKMDEENLLEYLQSFFNVMMNKNANP